MKILFFAFVIIIITCIGEVSSMVFTYGNDDSEIGENSRLLSSEEKTDYTGLNVHQFPVDDVENGSQQFIEIPILEFIEIPILVNQVNNPSQPPSNGVNNNLLINNFSCRYRSISDLVLISMMFLSICDFALIAIQSSNYPSPVIYCNKNWNNLTHINDLNLTHVKWQNSLVNENCIIPDCLKEMYSEGKENYSYKECLHQSCLDFKAKCDQGIMAQSFILLDIALLNGGLALFIFALAFLI
jgi:hypothetical protein